MGHLPEPAQGQAKKTEAAADGSKAITGTVTLAQSLASQVEPGDTLFVFARPVKGPPMPVAIQRVAASQLPFRFRLDDSEAMAAGGKLSKQAEVVVGARISKSGNALPQPGDLEGASARVAPGTRDLQLSIDRVVR